MWVLMVGLPLLSRIESNDVKPQKIKQNSSSMAQLVFLIVLN